MSYLVSEKNTYTVDTLSDPMFFKFHEIMSTPYVETLKMLCMFILKIHELVCPPLYNETCILYIYIYIFFLFIECVLCTYVSDIVLFKWFFFPYNVHVPHVSCLMWFERIKELEEPHVS